MADDRPRLDVLAVISIGGVIGAAARYVLAQAIPVPDNGFPTATLTANAIGSFLLGFLAVGSVGLLVETQRLRPFLTVGVIGSFTTFSAFAIENVVLVDRGDVLVAAAYVVATIVAGLAAARLGIEAARRFTPKAGAE